MNNEVDSVTSFVRFLCAVRFAEHLENQKKSIMNVQDQMTLSHMVIQYNINIVCLTNYNYHNKY